MRTKDSRAVLRGLGRSNAPRLPSGLSQWNKQYALYKEGKREKKPTANALKKHFQAVREKEFPWTFEVTKCVIEGAFDDLDDAFEIPDLLLPEMRIGD